MDFKKWAIAAVMCGMLGVGAPSKTFAAPPIPIEAVITDIIIGVFEQPYYDRPYYFYEGRYYYGGTWRNGYYYGSRLAI